MPSKDIEYNKEYWNTFYGKFERHTPSQFCVSVLTDLHAKSVVVELGSGNGRDSHYFASQGFITFALDLSTKAIESSLAYAEAQGVHHSLFVQGDLTKEEDIGQIIAMAREKSGSGQLVFYSRFVMHSIDDDQQKDFLDALSIHFMDGDLAYFEFRSKEDAQLDKHYGGHYRRYVDTREFEAALQSTVGLDIEYSITGRGMARFKEEDPFVSRIIARKGA
ncbi:MAG: class I SAM-dependent methyltransferase [Halioglobus sp.]